MATTGDPQELLTKMECCHLFCEKLKIGKNSYYKYYYRFIKFTYLVYTHNEAGKIQKRLPRIPRRIALGLINLLQDQHQPEQDPGINELKKYMNQVPDHV